MTTIGAPPLRTNTTPRLSLLQSLDQAYQSGERNLGLYGHGGMGKTTTAQQWALRCLDSSAAELKVDRAFWLNLHADAPPIATQAAFWLSTCGLKESAERLCHLRLEGARLADWLLEQLPDAEYLLIAANCESQASSEALWQDRSTLAFLTLPAVLPRWRVLFTARRQLQLTNSSRAAFTIDWQQVSQPAPTERTSLLQSLWGNEQANKPSPAELERRQQISSHPLCLYLYHRALQHGAVEPARAPTDKSKSHTSLDYYLSLPSSAARSLLLMLAYLAKPLQVEELRVVVAVTQHNNNEEASPWHQLVPDELTEYFCELQALGLVEGAGESYSLLPALQERILAAVPANSHETNQNLLARVLFDTAKVMQEQLAPLAQAGLELGSSVQPIIGLALRSALAQGDPKLLVNCLDLYQEGMRWTPIGEAQQMGTAVELWLQDTEEDLMQLPLLGALTSLWQQLNLYPRALQSCQAMLRDYLLDAHRGAVYHNIGRLHQKLQQWSEALVAYQDALNVYQQNDQHQELGDTYHQIGEVYERQQQWQQSIDAYQQALAAQEQHDQQHRSDIIHRQIGMIYHDLEQWQQALDSFQRALELQEEHAKNERIGLTYQQIGFIHELQGDLPLAGGYYDLALDAEQKLDEPNPKLLQVIQASRQRANCEQRDS